MDCIDLVYEKSFEFRFKSNGIKLKKFSRRFSPMTQINQNSYLRHRRKSAAKTFLEIIKRGYINAINLKAKLKTFPAIKPTPIRRYRRELVLRLFRP